MAEPTWSDGSDIDVGVGDILDIHAGVAGHTKFRMRVDSRDLDDAADIVITGPQFTATGALGRTRRVLLVSTRDFTVIARPRTEADGYLDVATMRWLGRQAGSKWWQMAGWFSGGKLGAKTHLACILRPNNTVAPVLGGNFRNEREARARVLEALAEGGASEGWVVTAGGARRVTPAG